MALSSSNQPSSSGLVLVFSSSIRLLRIRRSKVTAPLTLNTASVVATPPSADSSNADSTDAASQSPTAFSNSSGEGTKPCGKSFQLQSFLEQGLSDDSTPHAWYSIFGCPPAGETAAQDLDAARKGKVQGDLNSVDRLFPANDDSTPADNGDVNNKSTDDDAGNNTPDDDSNDNDASD